MSSTLPEVNSSSTPPARLARQAESRAQPAEPFDALNAKGQAAMGILKQLQRVVVAYSGGTDSTLVLKLAIDALERSNVLAVTGRSASVSPSELAHAEEVAAHLDVNHLVVDTDEFQNENYLQNPPNRCFYCKTTLYTQLEKLAREGGFRSVVNGTNADDLRDFRPGLRAADDFRVRSPLADAAVTKAEVRELSRQLGLPTHDKPASPCLSSRVQYGEAITPEKLRMIDAAESFLRSLGVPDCRVRHHDTLARIEVPLEWIPKLGSGEAARRIHEHFRGLGYSYVTIDLGGLRSGSMNEVITLGRA